MYSVYMYIHVPHNHEVYTLRLMIMRYSLCIHTYDHEVYSTAHDRLRMGLFSTGKTSSMVYGMGCVCTVDGDQ